MYLVILCLSCLHFAVILMFPAARYCKLACCIVSNGCQTCVFLWLALVMPLSMKGQY